VVDTSKKHKILAVAILIMEISGINYHPSKDGMQINIF
jgi:hypothetical protein